jgi:hypothetical protein
MHQSPQRSTKNTKNAFVIPVPFLWPYSGGVIVAVTGFLLLKSAMNARVISRLLSAYSKGA